MKLSKKIFNIILIFTIIQLISMIFVTNYTHAGWFSDIFGFAKKWDEMGNGSDNIINNAGNITNATNEIYTVIRIIGIGMFIVNFAFIFITLSMKNNGKDIAGAKLTIIITVILAILFIFAREIMEGLLGIFGQLESTM